MRLLVTGASGYIGARFVKMAMASGHEVVAASRRSVPLATSWVFYDLRSGVAPEVTDPIDAVVHLAADTSSSVLLGENIETSAAAALAHAARARHAAFIFISSQTARADAPTAYGRTKWLIEQDVLAAGGWVVRPGQVYGGPLQGLFGTLVETVRRSAALPAFLPPPRVQPIHVDDLAAGLLRLVEHPPASPRVLCLAATRPVSFSLFLKTIAHARIRRTVLFVPVPAFLVRAAQRLAPSSGIGRTLGRLTSLFDLPAMETGSSLQALGLRLRPLRSGLHPSGSDRRRQLLAEGRAMLAYVLKARSAPGEMRRYARAVETLHNGQALAMPRIFTAWPAALALLDRPASARARQGGGVDFLWRLRAATAIAEASAQGAQRFLALDRPCGVVKTLWGFSSAVAGEVTWRILALVLSPFLGRPPLPREP